MFSLTHSFLLHKSHTHMSKKLAQSLQFPILKVYSAVAFCNYSSWIGRLKLLLGHLVMAVKGSLAVLTQNVHWPQPTTLMAAVQLEPGISASGYLHQESTVPSIYSVGLQQMSTNIRSPPQSTEQALQSLCLCISQELFNCWENRQN